MNNHKLSKLLIKKLSYHLLQNKLWLRNKKREYFACLHTCTAVIKFPNPPSLLWVGKVTSHCTWYMCFMNAVLCLPCCQYSSQDFFLVKSSGQDNRVACLQGDN